MRLLWVVSTLLNIVLITYEGVALYKDKEMTKAIYNAACSDGEASEGYTRALYKMKLENSNLYYGILIRESNRSMDYYIKNSDLWGCMLNIHVSYLYPELYNAIEIYMRNEE